MSWQEPKTSWQYDDYINIEDFNRIRNNIEYLKDEADKLFKTFTFKEPLAAQENSYAAIPYPEKWNSLESCLNDIVNNTYVFSGADIVRKYSVYEPYIDFEELNRIESLCLEYYEFFEKQKRMANKLSFKLGNYGGVKV